MTAPALEPWPELSEFIRALVRQEVDAQANATVDGLAEFIRKHVRQEVDAGIGRAVDGLLTEILATIGQPEAKREPHARAVSAKQPRRVRSNNEWLTPKRAAQVAAVKPSTIMRWTQAGRLRRYGTQRRVLVSRADLERLIRSGGAEPTKRGQKHGAIAAAVVSLLDRSDAPQSATQIRNAIRADRGGVHSAVRALLESGEIVRCTWARRSGVGIAPVWTTARAVSRARTMNGHPS